MQKPITNEETLALAYGNLSTRRREAEQAKDTYENAHKSAGSAKTALDVAEKQLAQARIVFQAIDRHGANVVHEERGTVWVNGDNNWLAKELGDDTRGLFRGESINLGKRGIAL